MSANVKSKTVYSEYAVYMTVDNICIFLLHKEEWQPFEFNIIPQEGFVIADILLMLIFW